MKSAGVASSETLMTFTGLIPKMELARDKSLSEPQAITMHLISSYSIWRSFDSEKQQALNGIGCGLDWGWWRRQILNREWQQYTGPQMISH